MRGSHKAANHFCEQYRYSNYWRNIKTLAVNSHNRVMQNVTRNIKLNMQKTMIIICRQCFKTNSLSLSFHILFSTFFPIFPHFYPRYIEIRIWRWAKMGLDPPTYTITHVKTYTPTCRAKIRCRALIRVPVNNNTILQFNCYFEMFKNSY